METDSTEILDSFMVMANKRSRYQFLDSIEHFISAGDFATANSLIGLPIDSFANTDSNAITGAVMADDTTADNVVTNYIEYYRLLIKYMTDTLHSSDSSSLKILANKCPYVDGSVVFQARTLYSIVFNDIKQFNDLGCVDKEGIGNDSCGARHTNNEKNIGVEQQYLLQPNPNNGNFTLLQLITDIAPVEVQIFNETGVRIFKNQAVFENGISKFNIKDLNTGIYVLQLKDNKGGIFTVKFTVIN